MKKLIVLALLFAQTAMANVYVGTSYTNLDFDEVKINAIQFVAGNQFNEFLGVEARYGTGVSEGATGGATIELDSIYGAYATLSLPVGDSLYPYVIVGRTWAEATATYRGYSASGKDSTTSKGVGVRFDLREDVAIRAEYIRHDDIDGLSIGIQANF